MKKQFCVACFNIETFGYNPNCYQHTHFINNSVVIKKKSLPLKNDSRNRNNNNSK